MFLDDTCVFYQKWLSEFSYIYPLRSKIHNFTNMYLEISHRDDEYALTPHINYWHDKEMFVDISGLKKTEEDSTWNKTLAVLGELIGTAILIFLGCMACLGSMKPHIIGPSMIHIAFAFGLAVMIAIQVQIIFESEKRSSSRIVNIVLHVNILVIFR